MKPLFSLATKNIIGQQRPVFVTGAPRSGSSWVGEVLSICDSTRYVYEPFNHRWIPGLHKHLPHFSYLNDQSKAPLPVQSHANKAFRGGQGWKQLTRAAYRGYLSAATRPANHVIVKDPTASLMTEWLVKNFDTQVIFLMRHPCGFASSLDALDWKLNANTLLQQQELMRDHLEPFRDVLRHSKGDKWLTRGAVWAAVHMVFTRQRTNHPEWQLYRYEDICRNPLGEFNDITEKLQLDLGQKAMKKIANLSTKSDSDSGSTRRYSRAMPDVWKQRMSPAEIDAVMGMVNEFGLDYY